MARTLALAAPFEPPQVTQSDWFACVMLHPWSECSIGPPSQDLVGQMRVAHGVVAKRLAVAAGEGRRGEGAVVLHSAQ